MIKWKYGNGETSSILEGDYTPKMIHSTDNAVFALNLTAICDC